MNDPRHAAVTDIATRLLAAAEAAYKAAPKLVLDNNQPDPPPLSWHVAYTSAQFAEFLIRLCTLRKIQVSTPAAERPPKFDMLLAKVEAEAKRTLQFFGIHLAQEI